ncbi:unnamed protein product [Ceratitis capitata]|uniref:(Mediterranean fruit fly) hypothetical protein n=1 Tax=Ceratitis capitata TaxID=7213 RepID=A0A811VJ72_CERCA|nr:unnamed protein product [Ceratitis capitata]
MTQNVVDADAGVNGVDVGGCGGRGVDYTARITTTTATGRKEIEFTGHEASRNPHKYFLNGCGSLFGYDAIDFLDRTANEVASTESTHSSTGELNGSLDTLWLTHLLSRLDPKIIYPG